MIDERRYFCACAFMDKTFILGGKFFKNNRATKSCLKFDTRNEMFSDKSWKEIARIKETKYFAAGTVFQGNVIVSGGKDDNDNFLNIVESYDVFGDKWTLMPSMIKSRSGHSLVTVENKMFVIPFANNNCEVFNNFCKKFVAFKLSHTLFFMKAVSILNKMMIF